MQFWLCFCGYAGICIKEWALITFCNLQKSNEWTMIIWLYDRVFPSHKAYGNSAVKKEFSFQDNSKSHLVRAYRKNSKIWDTSNNCHNCPKNRKV